MKKNLKLSLLGVMLLSPLYADNQFTLEKIDVIASQGTLLDKKDVTDSVVIITKEAIQDSRVTTLEEALNKLGNISMAQNGGVGKATSMFIRGMDSKRILVLIDGVRYNNPTAVGAAAEFEQIMLYNVEQIEIIKGSQSGVWGADASSGVINIITSKAKKGLNGALNTEYGSFNTYKTSLLASYGAEIFDVAVGSSLFKTAGFSTVEPKKGDVNYGKRYNELGLEKDPYTNRSFNSKVGVNITKNDRVELNIQTIDSLVDFDLGAGVSGDSPIPNTKLKNRFYNLAYKHKDSLHDISFLYNLSDFDKEIKLPSWGGGGIDIYRYRGSVEEVKLDDKIGYLQDSFVRFGASHQKFEQKNVSANSNKSFSASSVFITNYNKLDVLAKNATILTQSLRYDKYDNFNNALTGKIGIKQFLYKDYFLSTNIGSGYNAPTLDQLYGQWGSNPNLKPEKSLTSDITIGNDIVWICGFYNEIDDLIQYDMNSWSYVQSSGKSKFRGVELGYKDFFADTVGIDVAYTHVKAQSEQKQALARRPKHQVDARLLYYVTQNIDIGVNAQYIGERYDMLDKQGAQSGKYVVANLVANIKANKRITFYGKIDNLSDKYYQSVDGYATAGRSVYLGLNLKY